MRKVFAFLGVGSLLFAACAEDNPTIGGTGATATRRTAPKTPGTAAHSRASADDTPPPAGTRPPGTGATGPTTPAPAADCAAAGADAFKSSGTLTIGTGNP